MLLLLAILGCGGEPYASGASEPFQVRGGVFHSGDLPQDAEATTPVVRYASSVGSVVTQGQGNIIYNGLATKDAWSVAVGFLGAGTGYWVVPVDGPDVTQDDDLLFDLVADFTVDVPFGLQTVSFVAIDEDEAPGPRLDTTVCIRPEAADNNLGACDPAVAPQSAVISLSWDTDVDLDLVVVTPGGKVVSAKAPTTALEEPPIPTSVVNDPTTGQLSRDSNGNCAIDGIRVESLVFPGDPPAGDYQVYASLHSACGESHVNWRLTLYRRVDNGDGTYGVDATEISAGALLPVNQDGGASLGTYVTTVSLP